MRVFGKISYPLYMTHYAAIWIFGNYYSSHQVSTTQLFWIISIGTIILIAFAYLMMIIYDLPIRKYLTEREGRFEWSISVDAQHQEPAY